MTARPVRDLLRESTARLREAGNPSARVDAELLLMHVLRMSRSQLVTASDVDDRRTAAYQELVARRASGVPLQHLTGSAPFRHLELAVGPGVFIPRPETELIIDLASAALANAGLVVDLGSGSGAIALSVAHEFPETAVIAVESSDAAFEWLSRNADARAVAGDRPITLVRGDIADADQLARWHGAIDVVLSNPPYVPTVDRERLSVEISHDPEDAVFAGRDGLELMPAVFKAAALLLRSGGTVFVEHDESHGQKLADQLPQLGPWRAVETHLDLAGRPRFVSAIRA